MKKLYISAVLGLLFVFVGGTKIHAQEPQNNNGVLDENKFIDETVYSYTQLISIQDGEVTTQAKKYIKTVSVNRSYKSLLNIVVARHYSDTTFTYGSGKLYKSPRALSNDWWTLPPNFKSGSSKSWDWYNTGKGATGRSNLQVRYTWGVPTPWGPVGSNYSSRIKVSFKSNGSWYTN